MSRIESSTSSVATETEPEASAANCGKPSGASASACSGQAAPSGPASQKDSFEKVAPRPLGSLDAPPRRDPPLVLPKPPAKVPEFKLIDLSKTPEGDEKNRLQGINGGVIDQYKTDYLKYLSDFREVYGKAKSLDQLRELVPAGPDFPGNKLDLVDGGSNFMKQMHRAHDAQLKDKVDAAYALLGRTPPGVLALVFKVEVSAKGKIGNLDVGGRGGVKASIDSRGQGKLEGTGGPAAGRGPLSAGIDEKGKRSIALEGELGHHLGVSVEAKEGGAVEVELGAARASFEPEEARFGGGVGISKKVHSKSGEIEGGLKADVQVAMTGMSPADVKRALSSWLAPREK